MKLRIILLFLTITSFYIAQPLVHKIGKTKTNFVTIAPSSVIEPNLVFYYSGNNPINKKIIDASGNGNHGDLNGGVVYAGGISGGLSFDGVNDYVSVANNSLIDFGNKTNSTVSFRLYISAIPSATQILISNENFNTTGSQIRIQATTGKLFYRTNQSGANQSTEANSSIPIGWSNIDVVKTGSSVTFYINGKLQTNGTTGVHVNSATSVNNLFIGSTTASSNYLSAIISELKLYNVALTASQVKEKWNKIANKPYIIEDFSDGTVGKFPRDWTRISGTHVVATGTPKYLNCTSTGNLYFTTRDNASSCYMTYDYYTAGAWTSKVGLVSALSTAEATLDYNATNRKLTFIMATNDRVRNIKITRGQPVQ